MGSRGFTHGKGPRTCPLLLLLPYCLFSTHQWEWSLWKLNANNTSAYSGCYCGFHPFLHTIHRPYPSIHTPAIWLLITVLPRLPFLPFPIRAFLLFLQLLHALGTLLFTLVSILTLLSLSLGVGSNISCSERASLVKQFKTASSSPYKIGLFLPYHLSPPAILLCINVLAFCLFVFTQKMSAQWGQRLGQCYSLKYTQCLEQVPVKNEDLQYIYF